MTFLSERGLRAAPSPTLAITAKTNALKAQGVKVMSFAALVSRISTRRSISRRRRGCAGCGSHEITPSAGTPS